MKHVITNIIPPRPGSHVGTLLYKGGSVTVRTSWMKSTHVQIGGIISFEPWLRYYFDHLDEPQHGIMDELGRGNARLASRTDPPQAEET